MVPIAFELPAAQAPLAILAGAWEAIKAAYPDRHGGTYVQPAGLGADIIRITLELPEAEPVYLLLLDALVAINVWARRTWVFPSIYDGLIRYEAEPDGLELWASTPALFARRFGDCEDLAADRVSQLQLAGVPAATALSLEERSVTGDRWHVLVQHPNGRIEDPSKALGMR